MNSAEKEAELQSSYGIEIDRNFRPVKYYWRPGDTKIYQAGFTEEIPAAEIIHIYKKEFPEQTRGISPLNATIEALKNLEDYTLSEILAAKAASCASIFYEENGNPIKGDFIDMQETNDKGEFAKTLEPFMASVVPAGYNVKTLTPTHPNGGFNDFFKAVMKQVASSLGVSYSRLLKDYSDVNYSSLREGTIDEAAFYAEQQSFLIDQWKEIEFKLFIEALALSQDSPIKPSQVKDILTHHTWICQKRAWFDPSKDILATERELKLGLKSPLMVVEESGTDPEELMKSWAQYKTMCEKYGLSFPTGEGTSPEGDNTKLATEDQDYNDENTQKDALNAER